MRKRSAHFYTKQTSSRFRIPARSFIHTDCALAQHTLIRTLRRICGFAFVLATRAGSRVIPRMTLHTFALRQRRIHHCILTYGETCLRVVTADCTHSLASPSLTLLNRFTVLKDGLRFDTQTDHRQKNLPPYSVHARPRRVLRLWRTSLACTSVRW